MTSITDPLGKVWTFTYDPNGNLATRVDAIANAASNAALGTTTFSHDRADRLTAIDYSDATLDVNFGYDNANRKTSMTDGGGTESYVYDDANRVTSTTRGSDSFSYQYNNDNQPTQVTYPDSTVVSLGYDDAGRLGSLTSGARSAAYSYDAASNLTGRTLPDGSGETRTYDRSSQLSEIATSNGSTTLLDDQITRNDAGAPTQLTKLGGAVETYSYDNAGRLTAVCYQSACPNSGDPQIDWTYDNVGNRVTETRPSSSLTYSFNADDRLTSTTDGSSTTNYTYDDDGRETAKGSWSFSYDLADNLTSATISSTTTGYSYDGLGNRLSTTTGSNTINYSWDENGPLAQLALERNGSGGLIRRYLSDSTGPLEMQTSSSNYTYLQNGLGSAAALSNGGSIAASYAYEPFGTRTVSGSSPPTNPVGFQGQYQDLATGLFDLRARQYDSTDGRFLSTDPLGARRSDPYISAYVFGNNEPTVFGDPSGQSICFVSAVCHGVETVMSATYDAGNEVGDAVYGVGKSLAVGTLEMGMSMARGAVGCVNHLFAGEMRGATRQCLKTAALVALTVGTDGFGAAAERGILRRLITEERGSLFGRGEVRLYHGSIHDFTYLREHGFQFRGLDNPTYLSREQRAAWDAIGPDRVPSFGRPIDSGVIEVRMPRDVYDSLNFEEKAYGGWNGQKGPWTEAKARTQEQIDALNRYRSRSWPGRD